MKASVLADNLRAHIKKYGDVDVVVSVDLSTEDEVTHGHRAFGDVYETTPAIALGYCTEIVILAEAGVLNYVP